jgi:hypothetical protein
MGEITPAVPLLTALTPVATGPHGRCEGGGLVGLVFQDDVQGVDDAWNVTAHAR